MQKIRIKDELVYILIYTIEKIDKISKCYFLQKLASLIKGKIQLKRLEIRKEL